MKPKAKAAPRSAPKSAAAPKGRPKKDPAAPKAAPKKTTLTTSKTKPAASKKRPKPDTEDEEPVSDASLHDASLLSVTPPSNKKQKKAPGPKKMGAKPLREVENEAIAQAIDASMHFDDADDPKPKKGSKATDTYQKLTQLEHIIKRPDTYIGSVEFQEKQMWVFNSELESMEMRTVSFVPGIYKIFDEILVNAADNKQRDKNMDTIKVTIDREKGEISVLEQRTWYSNRDS